jgi:hypothetical protein
MEKCVTFATRCFKNTFTSNIIYTESYKRTLSRECVCVCVCIYIYILYIRNMNYFIRKYAYITRTESKCPIFDTG